MTDAKKLFTLLEEGDFKLFKKAADRLSNVRIYCDRNGDFLLHRAVEFGSLAACKYLLMRGIPAACPGSRGATPLHYASARGDVPIMKILLRAASPPHSPINVNGMTPLHVAAGEGRLKIVKMLIEKGADSSVQDKFDRVPLHFAAGADQLDVVKWLAGRDKRQIDRPDGFGQRPIHWALQYERLNTANWLINHGVDLISSDIYGRTPLYFKTRKLTPMQVAIFRNDIREVKQRLLKPGTLNRRGDLGRTPLHTAAFARNRDLFRWMREKGADAKIVDDYGWTPIKLLSYRLLTCSYVPSRDTIIKNRSKGASHGEK
jgi:ankyrin repeat protein